jgi:hypothetical protein
MEARSPADDVTTMLAYLFWHTPKAQAQQPEYEAALLGFAGALARSACEGVTAAGNFRISAVPWLDHRAGYEDWVIVDGPAVLEDLNTAAVSGPVEAPHARVARMMEIGHGGLYYHLWGDRDPRDAGEAQWLTRPRGIEFRPVLRDMTDAAGQPVSVWRRFMVLGPGAEFVVLGNSPLDLQIPDGWKAHRVRRVALGAGGPANASARVRSVQTRNSDS